MYEQKKNQIKSISNEFGLSKSLLLCFLFTYEFFKINFDLKRWLEFLTKTMIEITKLRLKTQTALSYEKGDLKKKKKIHR